MSLYAATTDRPTSAFEFPRGSIVGDVRPPVATGEIQVILRSTRRIAVRTVFDDTGQPATMVKLSAWMGSSGSSSHGISDPAGKLQLRLPPGDYELTADPTQGEQAGMPSHEGDLPRGRMGRRAGRSRSG